MDQIIAINVLFFALVSALVILFMVVIFKFNNKDKNIVIEPTNFPILTGESVLFVSQKIKSSIEEGGGITHYDLGGSYAIITNKRLVISQGPNWMKLSLFFKKEYFDDVISNELLMEKFKYNSKVAIFNGMTERGGKLIICFNGQGREIRLMRIISDFLNVQLTARLWDFTEEDKKLILKHISENRI